MADWPYNTGAWKKLRAAHLARSPFCEGCTAKGNPYRMANTVDHVHAISEGGPAFPGSDGLAAYCASCHSQKTARGIEAGAVKTTRAIQPRKGCDANGNPLDPAHPWGDKSLRADPKKTAAYIHTQLVSKGNRNGR